MIRLQLKPVITNRYLLCIGLHWSLNAEAKHHFSGILSGQFQYTAISRKVVGKKERTEVHATRPESRKVVVKRVTNTSQIVERRMSYSRSYKARSDILFTTFIDRCNIFLLFSFWTEVNCLCGHFTTSEYYLIATCRPVYARARPRKFPFE